MVKDKIFSKKQQEIKKFKFNAQVAEVFDDMLSRSIPFYDEIHKITKDIIDRTFVDGGLIYDLGCSTGTTITLIDKHLKKQKKSARFIGIDNSKSMIEKSQEKIKRNRVRNTTLVCADIEEVEFEKSQLIIMNYTLQFIPVSKRVKLLTRMYNSLNKGGVFIFAEKIKSSSKPVDDLLTTLYYDFKKRNGYSELEIAQKREALENVLVPHTPEKQLEILKEAGFKKSDTLFRWYNFACFIGIK